PRRAGPAGGRYSTSVADSRLSVRLRWPSGGFDRCGFHEIQFRILGLQIGVAFSQNASLIGDVLAAIAAVKLIDGIHSADHLPERSESIGVKVAIVFVVDEDHRVARVRARLARETH